MRTMRLRYASWIIASAAVAGPIAFFGLNWLFLEHWAAATHQDVCMGPYFMALVESFLLAVGCSVVSLILGVRAFRQLASPRPATRVMELFMLSLPMLAVAGLVGWFFLTMLFA